MTGRLVWHALDVGDEPDWGQRYDNGPRPEPGPAADVTFHVADPEPADPDPDPEPDITFRVADPEPDWDQLRGDGSSLVETPTPSPRTRPDPQKQPQKLQAVFQDPSPHEMVGGVIYRPRDRLAPSRRSDLEATELAMFYKEPACVVLQRRKDDGCWRW
jgi:catechol 2,3-dioxygenase-like lactoylglutathione lyase family enzyme